MAEDQVCAVVRSLKRRRANSDWLPAYRSGRYWHDVTAGDINGYLRELPGREFTAKDFQTWHATVLAAVGLAVSVRAVSAAARRRAVARVCREVTGYLSNTPAMARGPPISIPGSSAGTRRAGRSQPARRAGEGPRISEISPRLAMSSEQSSGCLRTFRPWGNEQSRGNLSWPSWRDRGPGELAQQGLQVRLAFRGPAGAALAGL